MKMMCTFFGTERHQNTKQAKINYGMCKQHELT